MLIPTCVCLRVCVSSLGDEHRLRHDPFPPAVGPGAKRERHGGRPRRRPDARDVHGRRSGPGGNSPELPPRPVSGRCLDNELAHTNAMEWKCILIFNV